MKINYVILFFLFFHSSICLAELSKKNNVEEAEYYAFIKQVKCVTCQNQSVADSYAPMALIMRREIYHQFEQGKNEKEIKLLLIQRYGEAIFFAPEFKSKHIFIWLMPAFIGILGLLGLKRLIR